MNTLVDTASTTFSATTGFTLQSVIDWMADIIKLILGSGLALLDGLIGWIVALALIGAIVYFAFRAFRFFRT